MSIVNTIAATGSKSEAHRIRFFRNGRLTELPLARLDSLAARLARRLVRDGFKPRDRIGILARNGLEWILVDLAAIKAGLVTAGFEFGKFKDPGALINKYQLKGMYSDIRIGSASTHYDLRPVVEEVVNSAPTAQSYDESAAPSVEYAPDDITTIKFTSGSTGEPKGLGATVASIDGSIAAAQSLFHHGANDNILIFLPLSLLQQRYWIYSALSYGHDVTVVPYEFSVDAAQKAQPTVIMGVPGFFEGIKKQIERDVRLEADDLSGRKARIHSLLGSRIRYLWTGSAPASATMLHFFDDCGIPIFEGYGMNETCIVSKNYPGHQKIGSAGRLLPHKRARIDDDGVLIVGSDYPVNTAYAYCAPGDSEKIFMPGGEVRTGDLARIDAEGYLYILGRADDVVVLANGKNIHTRGVEEKITQHEAIDACVVIGSGKPFLAAIISPANACADRAAISAHIDTVNGALQPDERIVKSFIAPRPFTIDEGLLTSQFKPRRKEILRLFQREIDSLYGANA
jgi:long-chain acyl-CoA synthetase